MQLEPAVIDEIVRRVMEHLHAAPASTRVAGSPVSPSNPSASHGVTLSQPVITEDILSERVNGSKQVVISAKAILTPSARDFVRSRGIEIVRDANKAKRVSAGRWQVLAVAAASASAVVEQIRTAGANCEQKLCGSTQEAATQAVSAICRGEADGVIVLTPEPEMAACLANRNERIRAASVSDVNQAARVRDQVKANVYTINPGDQTAFGMRGIVKGIVVS